MRKQYKMTQEAMDVILEACKPVPYMIIGGHPPLSPQERANTAWKSLGREMGFDGMTVQPDGNDPLCFTAEELA